jgi:hypothetical protein
MRNLVVSGRSWMTLLNIPACLQHAGSRGKTQTMPISSPFERREET